MMSLLAFRARFSNLLMLFVIVTIFNPQLMAYESMNACLNDQKKLSDDISLSENKDRCRAIINSNLRPGKETVFDDQTKLIWQRGEGGIMDWNRAKRYCDKLSLGGYSDWRLPDKKELGSLYPLRFKIIFPDLNRSYYWTSSVYPKNEDRAWGVDFYYGDIQHGKKGNRCYVRCVRARL